MSPPPEARCHGIPPSVPLLPLSSHRRAKAQLWAAPQSEQGLQTERLGRPSRAAPSTAAPHHAATPANARLLLRAVPHPPHLGAAASAAHRHVTGPQRPVARAAEQAGAPSRTSPRPSPPPRLPASPPRGPAPALPTPGFRRRSSRPQHHLIPTPPTHSRERVRRLSREELCDQARAKVGGLLKNERTNRKNLPTCSGAASGSAPRVS